jgi:hypothetical protein
MPCGDFPIDVRIVIEPPTGDAVKMFVIDAAGNQHRVIFSNEMRDLSQADMITQATDKVRAKTNG